MEILKNFIVFEGADGSGTTTQIEKLRKSLESIPPPFGFYNTFEPTDGPIGRLIRSALKNEITLNAETIARLFAADRNEHLFGQEGITLRCGRGELVICDRYTPSSYVYQGITCGEALPCLLNSGFPGPELLFFLDIDPGTAQKRMKTRAQREIYEFLDFQIQVRERYLALIPKLRAEGIQVEVIDASQTADEIAGELWGLMQKMPIFNM
ncbi:MAG: dTMP kinase [Treponema sp.]|jgi:dTMP kinase|nr:dTMP kinase [Treponema sp.]